MIYIFRLVHNAGERNVTNNVTVTVGSTFSMQWPIREEKYIFYISTDLEKPEQRFMLSSGIVNYSRKYPKQDELFGNRLSIRYLDLLPLFIIHLEDVRYNETLSFHFKTGLNPSTTSTFNMIVVGIVLSILYLQTRCFRKTQNRALA